MCEDHDEFDVPIDETTPEAAELLGEYPSVEHYLRSVLEEFIHVDALWLLDYLDMARVLERFEGGRYRYVWLGGRVYRRGER
jgi:hypothetical protein